jgi:hypothetical protein
MPPNNPFNPNNPGQPPNPYNQGMPGMPGAPQGTQGFNQPPPGMSGPTGMPAMPSTPTGQPGFLNAGNYPPVNPYGASQPPQPGFPQTGLAPYTPPNRQFDQFNRPAPPPRPSVPFFLDPHGPYAHIGAPKPHKRKRKKGTKVILFCVVSMVVIGGIIVAMQGGGSDPDVLFQTAIENSLATHSYSQKDVAGQDNILLKQDVNDITAPRQSGTADLVSLSTKLEGYSSLKNSYIRYTQLPNTGIASTSTLANKWEQIRKDGALPAAYTQTASLEDLYEARTSVMGSYIIGNFAEADQQALVSMIQSKAVYSYDPGSTTSEDIDGQPVMRYDVKINADALKALNQKVGALMGLSPTDVDITIKQIDPDSLAKASVKMYVNVGSQRLVKVAITQGDQTSTVTYDAFNSSVVSNEPTADFQYAEFQTLLTGHASTSLTGKAQDTERKADINSLASDIEAYYTSSGFYPSLANVNDAAWVAANLKNTKDNVLTDPNGTTKQLAAAPKANQYAYQAYKDSSLAPCDSDICRYFKVTATLSDGTVYTKTSTR